ncbi:hypothetical protein HWV62_17872 [Athelia sp. TMB]|nr:hypothetical protein HWV62_17872 [Athelia sp. TMB]
MSKLSTAEKRAYTRAKNKAAQDAEEQKVASKPKGKVHVPQKRARAETVVQWHVPHRQVPRKSEVSIVVCRAGFRIHMLTANVVWIDPAQSKRKRGDSDMQMNFKPEELPKLKKRGRQAQSSDSDDEEDIRAPKTSSGKTRTKADALVPAAQRYRAPEFDESNDEDEGQLEYKTIKQSGSRRLRKQINHDQQDDYSPGNHSANTVEEEGDSEDSDGEDGLQGDTQTVQDALSLEKPQWSMTDDVFLSESNAPRKLMRKSDRSRTASTSSRSSPSILESQQSIPQSPSALDYDSDDHSPRINSQYSSHRKSKVQSHHSASHSRNGSYSSYRKAPEHTSKPTASTRRIIKQELERPLFLTSAKHHNLDYAAATRHRTPSSQHHKQSSRYCTPSLRHRSPPSRPSSSSRRHSPSEDTHLDEQDVEMLSDNGNSSPWPRVTHLVYSGRNKIDLKPQSKHIKELLHASVEEFRGDLFFVCTFPDLERKVKMLRKVLLRVADELDLPQEICTRLEKDPDYNEALGGILWARVSDWRAPLKVTAFTVTHSHYGSTADELAALIREQSYIYPGDPSKGTLKDGQPYEHPAFIEILRKFYFTALERRTGSKSIAVRYPSRFMRNDADESPEMADSMIASVAAAIHWSLKDRQSGLVLPSPFAADVVSDIYQTHILILKGLPAAHRHALKAKLYTEVT